MVGPVGDSNLALQLYNIEKKMMILEFDCQIMSVSDGTHKLHKKITV